MNNLENIKSWLIIGGAGYIGSHVARSFLKNGLKIVIVDDLSSGLEERIPENVKFINLDCGNHEKLNIYLKENNIEGIVHLAAQKQARESKLKPLEYWDRNVNATLGILKATLNTNVKYLIFSGSCSVYGSSGKVNEEMPLDPLSPYGWTKLVSEQIIKDFTQINNLSFISLRYFNVIGNDDFKMAHDTSEECVVPKIYSCIRNNQLPKVFGTDFNTPDGSALRDYMDVRDLAHVHYLAANYLIKKNEIIKKFLNVGTGKPISVLQIVETISKLLGKGTEYEDLGRNFADPDMVWSDTSNFYELFKWQPKFNFQSSIESFLKSAKAQ